MLVFAVPPLVCVMAFKEPATDKGGYESVPLNDTARGSLDDDEVDQTRQRGKATATDV
jgi:hypothetical protein